jgi:ubiquinone/menaquinone biosynthesis C-methylase UbiE
LSNEQFPDGQGPQLLKERTPETSSITNSAGHTMSSACWVDAHYLACQPEYEAMIRAVGLQSGWHVLDAGCGTGQFLSVIRELVGQKGRISAVDAAPENVAIAEAKTRSDKSSGLIDVRIADIKALPFPDGIFDAVWNANVAQYLSERELDTALAEFRRVLKPGGVLAVKDGDITALQIFPIPPTTLWRLLDAWTRRGDQQVRGLLRSVGLSRCLRKARFAPVKPYVTFIERMAPFQPPEVQFVAQLIEFFAVLAPTLNLLPADIEYWRDISNSRSPKYILRQPDLYLREAAILVIGTKPLT